jgi:peptidoglycan/LPS O-acetylase OafA/YrhL
MLTMIVLQWQSGTLATVNPVSFVYQALLMSRFSDTPLYVQVAWAVTNEIVFYLLIGMGISGSPARSLIWLAASILLTGVVFAIDATLWNLYFSILAGSLPFAAGAALYHVQKHIAAPPRWVALALLTVSALALTMVAAEIASFKSLLEHQPEVMGWAYASLAPSVLIIFTLYRLGGQRLRTADDQIGKLSYPIYLLHFMAAMIAVKVGILETGHTGSGIALIVLAISIALSITILVAVDRPVQALRARIRAGAQCRRAPIESRATADVAIRAMINRGLSPRN